MLLMQVSSHRTMDGIEHLIEGRTRRRLADGVDSVREHELLRTFGLSNIRRSSWVVNLIVLHRSCARFIGIHIG